MKILATAGMPKCLTSQMALSPILTLKKGYDPLCFRRVGLMVYERKQIEVDGGLGYIRTPPILKQWQFSSASKLLLSSPKPGSGKSKPAHPASLPFGLSGCGGNMGDGECGRVKKVEGDEDEQPTKEGG